MQLFFVSHHSALDSANIKYCKDVVTRLLIETLVGNKLGRITVVNNISLAISIIPITYSSEKAVE